MSGTDDGGAITRREVAYRMFAAEYDGADLEYSDSEEERAPNYVVTPTGARVNRLFAVGVLTEVEPVSDDVLRARVADPTGAFVVYAGQYQPEAVGFLEAAEVPAYVALTGKARTFQPEDSDRVFTSVRPESMTTVDAATRDRWTVQAAAHTLARVATMAWALDRDERGEALERTLETAGVDPGLASGTALAIDHYGTTPAYLSAVRQLAIAATEIAAGDRDTAPAIDLAPDDDGPVTGDLTAAPAVVGTLTDEAATGAEAPAVESVPADDSSDTPAEAPSEESATVNASPTTSTATEPSAEPADTEATGSDLGTVDAGDGSADSTAEPYELDEAEREAVEAEYGTEFSTGSEVGDPGEAGIEPEVTPPDAEGPVESVGKTEAATDEVPETTELPVDVADDMPTDAEADAPDQVDLEEAAVDAMRTLDDGDGVDHEAVVESVAESTGASTETVESAIQDALMGGLCYEPDDGLLKAI